MAKETKKKVKKSPEAEIKEANNIAAADPKYQGKSKARVKLNEIILAMLGVIFGAFATECMMIPNGLTYGGITGLSRMVQHYTGMSYSLAYYIFSAIIVIFVLVTLGLKEVRKIIILSVAYPTVMLLLEMTHIVVPIEDTFLAAVMTGVVFGISNGLTFQAGYSSGGTDSVAKVLKLKKYQHKSINDITTIINMGIVFISMLVFGIIVGLYAVVTMYVSMKVGEAVMFGFTKKLVQLEILTNCADELSEYVMQEMGRGVSSNKVTGEYTGESRKQLRIICTPRESILVKKFLAECDPHAFVSVITINSVWGVGRGFKDINSPEV